RYAGLKPWLPIYATCALALSPYYAGASLYYYTDIPCLFAMMLALNFYLSGRPIAGAVAAGVALLIRQFSVFLPAAYVLTSVTKPRAAWRDLRHGVPLVLPFVMFLPLAVLWRGISPQNHLHELIRQVGFFHLEFVNYLVIATGVYSLPLAILRTREILQPHRLLVAALLTPLLLTALPRPNPEILDLPVKTLGYLDIALTSAFGDHKTFPYLVLWVLGCLILLEVLHIERHEPEKLILFAIAGFFVMHLFAHMVWDKYVLLILPMVFLSLGRGRTRSMRPACAVREA
ncbi:MAG: hypothetical protein HY278_03365, partial [candidate division NC10 bacterium]|nr:hypothetical protein [candidate division NC10 bacterium]